MELDLNFWKNKKVFLTGHTGFKGTWLSLILESLGAQLHGYSLKPDTKPSFFESISFDGFSTIGDIRDYDSLKKTITKFEPDIIIHMAAQPLVRLSYDDPVGTYGTNVLGLVNLLDVAKTCRSLKAILNVTSDKCYENKEWLWGYRENDRLGGHDPYSNSKACAELVTNSFLKSYFHELKVGLATARAGNVIGGGDWSSDRLIPDYIRAQQSQSSLEIRSPNSIRPWQHVLEPITGYLKLVELLYHDPAQFSEPWNFGPKDNDVITVREVIEELQSQASQKVNVVYQNDETKHEASLLKLDPTKSNKRLNWSSQLNIHEAVKYTLNWYDSFYNNRNMTEVTMQQFSNYLKM
jgi:CDP-glucose 4,6-dehydratase